MYFNFQEAKKFKTVNTHVSVRNIKIHASPVPSDYVSENLDRCFILISENKKMYLAGLKNFQNCGPMNHIWHYSDKPTEIRAKFKVHLRSR